MTKIKNFGYLFAASLKTPVPLIQFADGLGEEVDAVGDVFFVGHFDDLLDEAGGDGLADCNPRLFGMPSFEDWLRYISVIPIFYRVNIRKAPFPPPFSDLVLSRTGLFLSMMVSPENSLQFLSSSIRRSPSLIIHLPVILSCTN